MRRRSESLAESEVATPGTEFQNLNRAYNGVFRPNRLSLGLVAPLERYTSSAVPTMTRHLERAVLAEELGFAAMWLRDVPFHVPAFGDAGQVYDPFVYLGLLAGRTQRIALGVASVVLPLRHPGHVAKSAASADALSGGRLLLGVASGDRPEEYPALAVPFDERGARFREGYDYVRRMEETFPRFHNAFGTLRGDVDMLPKPPSGRVPLLITGSSRQDPEWVARNGDGWMVYPRETHLQERILRDWRARIEDAGRPDQPVMQPLYLDLVADAGAAPEPIHLGFRVGVRHLRTHLRALESIGANHVALNLRFHQGDIETTMTRLAHEVLPGFSG